MTTGHQVISQEAQGAGGKLGVEEWRRVGALRARYGSRSGFGGSGARKGGGGCGAALKVDRDEGVKLRGRVEGTRRPDRARRCPVEGGRRGGAGIRTAVTGRKEEGKRGRLIG